MVIYETKLNVKLNKEIPLKDAQMILGKFITNFLISNGYKEHNDRKYKGYVFSDLGYAKNYVYKTGEYKTIIFRTILKDIDKLVRYKDFENEFFKVTSVEKRNYNVNNVRILYTQTPTIVVKPDGMNWIKDKDSIIELKKLVNDNLVKKYKYFIDSDVQDIDWIEQIQIKNQYALNYKNGFKMVGSKLFIVVKGDDLSQKIASIAYGVGLGNKNSILGTGFIKG